MDIIGDRLPGWVHDRADHTGQILQACLKQTSPLPNTLVHFDYRLANLCFDRSADTVAIIDWQSPFIHTGYWDLAHFVIWSLPVEIRRRYSTERIERYLGDTRVPDTLHATFRQVALFLLFNLIRSVPAFDFGKADHHALFNAFLERSLAAAEDFACQDLISS